MRSQAWEAALLCGALRLSWRPVQLQGLPCRTLDALCIAPICGWYAAMDVRQLFPAAPLARCLWRAAALARGCPDGSRLYCQCVEAARTVGGGGSGGAAQAAAGATTTSLKQLWRCYWLCEPNENYMSQQAGFNCLCKCMQRMVFSELQASCMGGRPAEQWEHANCVCGCPIRVRGGGGHGCRLLQWRQARERWRRQRAHQIPRHQYLQGSLCQRQTLGQPRYARRQHQLWKPGQPGQLEPQQQWPAVHPGQQSRLSLHHPHCGRAACDPHTGRHGSWCCPCTWCRRRRSSCRRWRRRCIPHCRLVCLYGMGTRKQLVRVGSRAGFCWQRVRHANIGPVLAPWQQLQTGLHEQQRLRKTPHLQNTC